MTLEKWSLCAKHDKNTTKNQTHNGFEYDFMLFELRLCSDLLARSICSKYTTSSKLDDGSFGPFYICIMTSSVSDLTVCVIVRLMCDGRAKL